MCFETALNLLQRFVSCVGKGHKEDDHSRKRQRPEAPERDCVSQLLNVWIRHGDGISRDPQTRRGRSSDRSSRFRGQDLAEGDPGEWARAEGIAHPEDDQAPEGQPVAEVQVKVDGDEEEAGRHDELRSDEEEPPWSEVTDEREEEETDDIQAAEDDGRYFGVQGPVGGPIEDGGDVRRDGSDAGDLLVDHEEHAQEQRLPEGRVQ